MLFAVLGDFNDSPDSELVAPLVKDAGLENVIERLDQSERWTHWWAGKNAEVDFTFDSFEGVTDEVDASDHCPTFLEIEI